ncbi:MAG: four helix bundle protein [Patescibacteria group bacterium]|nr:four helix bundle protein [Patescibacteria group bacterium]
MNNYIKFEDLDVYKISRELSGVSWEIFQALNSEQKYIFGKQFVTAVDSIGANIAEGYGRYHYLDKIRFYYNARASLFESKHWVDLLHERKVIDVSNHNLLLEKFNLLNAKLNNFIKATLEKSK